LFLDSLLPAGRQWASVSNARRLGMNDEHPTQPQRPPAAAHPRGQRPPTGSPAPKAGGQKRTETVVRPFSVQVMFTAIFAIVLILAINFSSRLAATQPLQQTYEEVSREIERLRAEQSALMSARDFVRSDAFVEQWARDEGKMIRPGEVLVIPVPSATDVELAPDESAFVAVETTPPLPEPWLVWWRLFFDSPPPDL
jgi:cell division protein FtsB